MDLGINHAGQNRKARAIDHFPRRCGFQIANRCNLARNYANIAGAAAHMVDQFTIFQNEVECLRHGRELKPPWRVTDRRQRVDDFLRVLGVAGFDQDVELGAFRGHIQRKPIMRHFDDIAAKIANCL
jgi:hypothetical protein